MAAGSSGKKGLPAGLAAPARRALAGAGVKSLRDVARLREADVAQMHGIGPNALAVLRAALQAEGLSFAGGAKGGR